MVMEAQIESGTFGSQNVGGPLSVTSMLAAVVAKKIDSVTTTRHGAGKRVGECTLPICSKVKIPVQTHSNATCDVQNDENLMFANALLEKRVE
jgi:hypothetical protein